MAPPAHPFASPSQFDRFLHATIKTERNGMELSVLSLLARVGLDPWAEAARLAELPRDAAADSLANTFASLPAGSFPPAQARMVALCLVPLLPDQDHPAPGTLANGRRHDGCMRITLLTGAVLSAGLAMWLLIGAAVWAIFHAGPPAAIVAPSAGATITDRPSPIEQPGHHRANSERPVQVRSVVVRLV